MFTEEQVNKTTKEGKLSHDVAVPMLNLYVFPLDNWWHHVENRLYPQLRKKHKEEEAISQIKDVVSFTILFPAYDRTVQIDRVCPENNLFKWMWFDQRSRMDWFKKLQTVVKFDYDVSLWRKEVLDHGIINPKAIAYQPLARQAFNWLCQKSEDSEELTDDAREKFERFVMAYGGAAICYLFEEKRRDIENIVNWRSPYFVERLLYRTYTVEQVIEIKRKEFAKTNSDYIQYLSA